MFEGFFVKTTYEKVKTLFHFKGSKVFFRYHTKCYFAQRLLLNLTVSTPIAVVGLPKLNLLIFYTC